MSLTDCCALHPQIISWRRISDEFSLGNQYQNMILPVSKKQKHDQASDELTHKTNS